MFSDQSKMPSQLLSFLIIVEFVTLTLMVKVAQADVTTINKEEVIELMKKDTGLVDNNEVTYAGEHPHVVVETVLPGFPFPSFEVNRQVNPTLIFEKGIKDVTITVINTNSGAAHSFMITQKPPPYSALPNPNILHAMAIVPELDAATDGHYETYTVKWTLPGEGTYWYLCRTPGHASTGMFGKIEVK